MSTYLQTPSFLRILGIPVHSLSRAQALTLLGDFVAEGGRRHAVTVNPEYLVQARARPDFQLVLRQADLALPDGVGLALAARLLGAPLVARITGVDLLEDLAALAALRGYRLFLLGAGEGVAEAAARRLEARFQGLVVADTYAGSPRPEDELEAIRKVRAAAPDILFVAYGAPAQDLWIRRNLERLGVPLAIGIGGAFDYVSGRVPRAPRWMQRLGLEWLYRLWREPWRWRRMLRLPQFVWLVLLQRLGRTY